MVYKESFAQQRPSYGVNGCCQLGHQAISYAGHMSERGYEEVSVPSSQTRTHATVKTAGVPSKTSTVLLNSPR
jgi:hypothetical protein